MTPQADLQVQSLVIGALEALIELAHEPLDYEVEPGSEHCEPYFAVSSPCGAQTIVVEGDYRRRAMRVRDLEGRAYLEVDAGVPAALSLEPLLAWWRTLEWAGRADDAGDDGRREDSPETNPAPLSAF